MSYRAHPQRYDEMQYRRCGRSGLRLPAISLGLWHNFNRLEGPAYTDARSLVRNAFDAGITHLDLANNYGPPPGAAETFLGRVLGEDLAGHRDELVISTKAGWQMWPGPYGDWGSRKYLVASLDQSLSRLGLDYVDIFYHHRPDPETPLEETMGALDFLVRQGKALYVGISAYDAGETARAVAIAQQLGTPLLVHQLCYNMLDRGPELGLFDALVAAGMGCVAFCPLAQGKLSSRYLDGVPADSRAADPTGYLDASEIDEGLRRRVKALAAIAEARQQTVAQLALAWALRHEVMSSVIVGVSRASQLAENLGALQGLALSPSELGEIDAIVGLPGS